MRRHLATTVVLSISLTAQTISATTYISVEPIPNRDVVGENALTTILTVGYPNLELWSNRLLNDCGLVQNVIDTLASNGAISTVNPGNTRFLVAAGGFEAVTNPSYVLTVQDSGPNAVSAADINVLDNALGYVLSQGGTAHFSPDDAKAYDFSIDYAVVTFAGALSGAQAKGFFDFLGTIDPALWSGAFAGFTQMSFRGRLRTIPCCFSNPPLLSTGLLLASRAASHTPGATYVTLNNNNQPTTAKAGVAFPGNDWIAFPDGAQYLSKLGNLSPDALSTLAEIRGLHLQAVGDLVAAIENGYLSSYLTGGFACPALPAASSPIPVPVPVPGREQFVAYRPGICTISIRICAFTRWMSRCSPIAADAGAAVQDNGLISCLTDGHLRSRRRGSASVAPFLHRLDKRQNYHKEAFDDSLVPCDTRDTLPCRCGRHGASTCRG